MTRNQLIDILRDPSASEAERDDAAMQLELYPDEETIAALLEAANDRTYSEMIRGSCGESLAGIWLEQKAIDFERLAQLTGIAREEAVNLIRLREPSAYEAFLDDLDVERVLQELIRDSRLTLTESEVGFSRNYVYHSEYEMAFEGLVIQLYRKGTYPAYFDYARWRDLALTFDLRKEAMYDPTSGKSSKHGQRLIRAGSTGQAAFSCFFSRCIVHDGQRSKHAQMRMVVEFLGQLPALHGGLQRFFVTAPVVVVDG